MAHQHQHTRIPSPLQTVNQYEAAFVRKGNKFIAEATAAVIGYARKLTTDEINKNPNVKK